MTRDELIAWWHWFSESECQGYSPLYESICDAVAESGDVLDRILELSNHTRQPNMLLAAVHDLVLQGGAPELAPHYDGTARPDGGAQFVTTVREHWDALVPVLEARRTQTNEIGRVGILAPALAHVAAESGRPAPPTLIDVGTSAGLTLTLPRVRIDYGDRGTLGPAGSPVQVSCDVLAGEPPIVETAIARRIGLDRRPLDPTDADDARWLAACTWPDTGRLDRTRRALALAAAYPSELRTGDAVADLPALLAEVDGPMVVTTTWALAYLPDHARLAFADVLASASTTRPVTWISCEAPGVVAGLPHVEPPDVDGISASVLGAITFAGGDRRAETLGHAHPHGRWLWWHG